MPGFLKATLTVVHTHALYLMPLGNQGGEAKIHSLRRCHNLGSCSHHLDHKPAREDTDRFIGYLKTYTVTDTYTTSRHPQAYLCNGVLREVDWYLAHRNVRIWLVVSNKIVPTLISSFSLTRFLFYPTGGHMLVLTRILVLGDMAC